MLIEIHMLQNHAPSNLNRDDTGSPKDCIFGGVRRARISSQCLKRSIRRSQLFINGLDGVDLAVRTRRLPERVKETLVQKGISEELAKIAEIKATGFGTKEGKERAKELNTAQTMFLTETDINAVAEALYEAIQECGSDPEKFSGISAKDLQGRAILRGWRPITPDIALFGRMTTSEAFRDVEAAAQVAHAISTNKMDHEFDYYVAVDDLQGIREDDESTGADMIGDIEFNSACYYKYFSIDLDALVDNLAGSSAASPASSRKEAAETARAAVLSFLKAAVFTTPSGKQNSFAAHQLPAAILVEVRPKKTPVSFANAFVKPARPYGDKDLITVSIEKFAGHVEALTQKFSLRSSPRLWFTTEKCVINGTEECKTLDELLEELKRVMAEGE